MPATIPKCNKGECCSKGLYQEIPINTWDELQALYCRERKDWSKRWVFRGQKSSTWCLTTTLERTFLKRLGYPSLIEAREWENLLLRQFKRNAPRLLNQPPRNEDYMEWLALMRHYGAPTRLFDWTYSFWVALYLAIESVEVTGTCAVWALDIDWWKDCVKERMPVLKEILKKGSNTPKEFNFILNRKDKPGIWPVNPFRLNERLYAQQGIFVLPIDVTKPFMENLRALVRQNQGADHLCKIVITCDRDLLTSCLTELHRMNINSATLFPGLDGLARNLENQIFMPQLFTDVPDKESDLR